MPKSARSQQVDSGEESLTEGRKSGRARKKTFKGAEFDEQVKVKQKKGDATEREVKNEADLSEAGHTAGNTSLEASKPSGTRKRGRPRKTPVSPGSGMKVGRLAKDNSDRDLQESQEKCQGSAHASSLSAADNFVAGDTSKVIALIHREDDSADISSGNLLPEDSIASDVSISKQRVDDSAGTSGGNLPAEDSIAGDASVQREDDSADISSSNVRAKEISVASDTKHRENSIADVSSNSLPQEELSVIDSSILEHGEGDPPAKKTSHTDSKLQPSAKTSSVDVPAKRKRGRPKKVPQISEESSVASDTKHKGNTNADVSNNSLPGEELSAFDSSLLEHGKDGRHQTEDTSSYTKLTPKRGRGRPRKHRPEAGMDSESPSVLKTPKEKSRTGADKGEVIALPATSRSGRKIVHRKYDLDEDKEQTRPSRSRSGRKITRKKYDVESEEDDNFDDMTSSEKNKTKRISRKKNNSDEEVELEENTGSRKGRRRSSVKYDYKDEDSTEETTPVRNRRSRKTVVQREDSDDDEEEEKVVKKKRGRKSLSWNESSAKTNVEIKACLRCEEKMKNLKQYKYHLMTVHCAMYTAECPSGEESFRAFQHILKILKQLRCPKCSKVFRFSHYYKHHRTWCGREDEQETCSQCGRLQKAMWMAQHVQWHKRINSSKDKIAAHQDGASPLTDSGGKRRAATASLKKIKAAVAVTGEDEEPGSSPKQAKKSKLDRDWQGKNVGDNDDDDDDDDLDVGKEKPFPFNEEEKPEHEECVGHTIPSEYCTVSLHRADVDRALQGRPACTCAPTVLTPLVHIISNPTLNTQTPSINDTITTTTTETNPMENIATENTTTEHTTAEHTAMENSSTENIASENTSTENIATENTSTENIATENTSTENIATENTSTENIATENNSTENRHLPSAASEQRRQLLNDVRLSRLNRAQLNKQAECNELTQAAVAQRLQQCNTVSQASSELSRVELHKLKLECEIEKLQQEKQVLSLQASNERLRQIQLQLQLQRMGVDVSPTSLGFDLDMPVSLPTIKQDSGIDDC